ncbi:hypothetical protein KP509_20G056800 [Ceratopteris richardii]|uniref:Choline kinase n=1 Tax=Ceratopteris richardii TaxID=49495 RepID=A0A8T2SJH5_CERRI|nr:hypothetical protein KP509_20G056800 [Ceratopteris richardii]
MDLSPVSVNQWDSENWSKLPPEALQTLTLTLSIPINANIYVRQLKGAMTNEVYQCSWDIAAQYCEGSDINAKGDKEEDTQRFKGDKSRNAVLVRVYGKGVENFFDREDEIRTFEAISNAGQGPRLLGLFATGRIEEFLHARTLTPQDLRHPNVSAMIAVKLREFHQLPIGGEHAPQIWKRLRDWLNEAINICSGENLAEFGLHNIRNEIEELENKSSTLNSEVGFCHNDLQYGNILMDNKDGSLTFIDYEYAAYNPVAYDLANHFCEMTADYHTDSPHVLDFSKYPDLQERQRFIREYLRSSDADVNQCQVEKLSSEVDFYGSTSHLLWGLWGLISHHVNGIDFNYIEYARQRFRKFHLSKAIYV